MIRRLLLALSWPFLTAACVLAAMGVLMLINRVPDAAGGAGIMALLAACAGSIGAGLQFVAGRRT